ncbi:hypothetical protein ACLKA7_012880 [Drosophila subpalustris]
MESNIAININVNSNPVSTETLDLQRIVDDLRNEFEEMKAERGRETAELDALRQQVAELNSRVATLEAAGGREAAEGGERGAMAAREGLAEEEGERTVKEARVEGSLPDRPFTDLNDFLQFERSLETDAALQNVIRTLGTNNTAQSTKEWVNTSWHLVLSDDVGRLCSWTGIRGKQCVRDLRITLAMRILLQLTRPLRSLLNAPSTHLVSTHCHLACVPVRSRLASLRIGSSACVTEKMPTLLHALANLRSSQITFSSSLRTGSSACVKENADSASVYFNVRPPCLRYKSSLLSASRLSQPACVPHRSPASPLV